MRTVDTHFHWFPRDWFEGFASNTDFPRAEKVGDGYVLRFNGGRAHTPLPAVWFDLEAGLAASRAATGEQTTVISTAGVLTGVLDQLPLDRAYAAAEALNDALAKVQSERDGDFYGTASVPLLDTGRAIELLDHAVETLGLRAVNLPSTTGAEPIDVSRLEPFYRRVEELGVPLIVHPNDVAFADVLTGYGDALQRTIGRPFDTSITILRLVFSGILERHPDLNVVHTHAGGYLPQQAGRIDKNARIPDLPRLPSEYLRRIYTDTVAPQAAESIRRAMDFYGEDHVMYGTDYPCWSPRAAGEVISQLELSGADLRSLYSDNATRLFKIN